MNRWALIVGAAVAALTTSACGGPQVSEGVRDCEAQLLAKLLSPTSFNRVEATEVFMTGESGEDRGRVTGSPQGGHVIVLIEYDAANGFGAMLRGREICYYVPRLDNENRADVAATREADLALLNWADGDDRKRAMDADIEKARNALFYPSIEEIMQARAGIQRAYAIDYYEPAQEAQP